MSKSIKYVTPEEYASSEHDPETLYIVITPLLKIFRVNHIQYGTKKRYLSLEHDVETLYFCYDTEEVFYGDVPVFDFIRKNFLKK